MKTALQKQLAQLAPHVSIKTLWETDPDHYDIRKDCDGFDDCNPEDWACWQSEIRATAIVDGEEISGSAYLGGTWEKAGDRPWEGNPEISGYEPQMTEEAVEELSKLAGDDSELQRQLGACVSFLRRFMREEYEKQRTEAAA